jgi:uncharacterized metal-binding protein YceD (DUF177 family)
MKMPAQIIRTSEIVGRRPRGFRLVPDASLRAEIAADLGLLGLEALEFAGEVRPAGRDDLHLEARLIARVVQPCIVSLAPVISDLSETVVRRYLAAPPDPGPGETEMPEDDTIDVLTDRLDLGAVMIEALVLALPDYPRASGQHLGELAVAPPGAAPLEPQQTARPAPFAALARLQGGAAADPPAERAADRRDVSGAPAEGARRDAAPPDSA